jgi:hypothetical protein
MVTEYVPDGIKAEPALVSKVRQYVAVLLGIR